MTARLVGADAASLGEVPVDGLVDDRSGCEGLHGGGGNGGRSYCCDYWMRIIRFPSFHTNWKTRRLTTNRSTGDGHCRGGRGAGVHGGRGRIGAVARDGEDVSLRVDDVDVGAVDSVATRKEVRIVVLKTRRNAG